MRKLLLVFVILMQVGCTATNLYYQSPTDNSIGQPMELIKQALSEQFSKYPPVEIEVSDKYFKTISYEPLKKIGIGSLITDPKAKFVYYNLLPKITVGFSENLAVLTIEFSSRFVIKYTFCQFCLFLHKNIKTCHEMA